MYLPTPQNVIKCLKVSEPAKESRLQSAEFSHLSDAVKNQDLQLMPPAEKHLG